MISSIPLMKVITRRKRVYNFPPGPLGRSHVGDRITSNVTKHHPRGSVGHFIENHSPFAPAGDGMVPLTEEEKERKWSIDFTYNNPLKIKKLGKKVYIVFDKEVIIAVDEKTIILNRYLGLTKEDIIWNPQVESSLAVKNKIRVNEDALINRMNQISTFWQLGYKVYRKSGRLFVNYKKQNIPFKDGRLFLRRD